MVRQEETRHVVDAEKERRFRKKKKKEKKKRKNRRSGIRWFCVQFAQFLDQEYLLFPTIECVCVLSLCEFAINHKLTLATPSDALIASNTSIDKDAPIAAPASTEPLVVRQDILVVLFFVVDEETDKTASIFIQLSLIEPLVLMPFWNQQHHQARGIFDAAST